MKRKKLIASGLIASMITPYCNLTAYAKVSASEYDVKYYENDEIIVDDGNYPTTVKVSVPYTYTMTIPKDDQEFMDVCDQALDDYYELMPLNEDSNNIEVIDAIQEMANILQTYKSNLSEDDQELLEELINNYEDNGILTSNQYKQMRSMLGRLAKTTASASVYSKSISKRVSKLESSIDETLINQSDTNDELDDSIYELLDVISREDLSTEDQATLEELQKSYEANGELNDVELASLVNLIHATMKLHTSSSVFYGHLMEDVKDVIDNYNDLDEDVINEITQGIVDDLEDSEELDYRDEIAIKDILYTLNKNNTPTKEQLETLINKIDEELDKTDESYDEAVNEDVQDYQTNLMDILTSDTIKEDEVAQMENKVLVMVDSNKDELSNDEQKLLEELKASYEKNGKLADNEVVELMDLLDSIAEGHMTKSEYDAYSEARLDDLIDNYDNLSDIAKQELSNTLIDDLENISNVNYRALLRMNSVRNILANSKTPTKANIQAIKTALNTTLTDKEYDAQVGNDVENNTSDLLEILTKETTNKNDIEKSIKDSFIIADANTKDLTDTQKKSLSELESAYDKNEALTETQIIELMDIMDSILEDHVTKSEYDTYMEQGLSNIISKYDKLSDTAKKGYSTILMKGLKSSSKLNYKAKLAINNVEDLIEDSSVPTKASLTSIKEALALDTTSSSYDKQLATDVESSQTDIIKVLNKTTTTTKSIARNVRNALDIANYNTGSLSDTQKTTLNDLQTSFNKNGSLTESELVSLMDILDSVLYNHVTKSEYDTYSKTRLDDIISSYDKFSDTIIKGFSNSLMPDLYNINNLNYKAKQEILAVQRALSKGTKPTKAQLTAIRDAMNATLNSTNYDKQVVEDIKDFEGDIFDVFTSTVTNKDDISDIIKNSLNLLSDNKNDLTSSEQKTFDKLVSSFSNNSTLTNAELVDLIDLLNADMQKHVGVDDYLKYMLELENKIYNNYDKLPSNIKDDLPLSIVNDLLGFETRLSTENKNTLNLLKVSLTLGIEITKDQLQNLSKITNEMINYSQATTTTTTTTTDTTSASTSTANSSNKNNVQTSDNAPLFAFMGLAFVSLVGMVEAVFKKKKK